MRSNSSSLMEIYPYSRIGPASSRAAILRNDTASSPPSSASVMAAATIRSRVERYGGRGSGRSYTVMATLRYTVMVKYSVST